MIIEARTGRLKTGTATEFEKRFAPALPIREKQSKLGAFRHTDVAALNQVIRVWPHESLEQSAAVRAAAAKEEGWPPATRELVISHQAEVFHPAPFSPPLTPRDIGPVFEISRYTIAPGAMPGVIERWTGKIGERVKLSPLVGGWHSEFGGLNKWVHIWAYRDAAERQRIRTDALARGRRAAGRAARSWRKRTCWWRRHRSPQSVNSVAQLVAGLGTSHSPMLACPAEEGTAAFLPRDKTRQHYDCGGKPCRYDDILALAPPDALAGSHLMPCAPGGPKSIRHRARSSEIRNWIRVAGAVEPLNLAWIGYVPGYRTPALTGTGLGFASFR